MAMALFKKRLRDISTDTERALRELLNSQVSMQDDLEQRNNELQKQLVRMESRLKALEGAK